MIPVFILIFIDSVYRLEPGNTYTRQPALKKLVLCHDKRLERLRDAGDKNRWFVQSRFINNNVFEPAMNHRPGIHFRTSYCWITP